MASVRPPLCVHTRPRDGPFLLEFTLGKVLTGIGEIGLAVGLGALAFFDPAVLAIPGYAELASSLFLAGVSSEVER